MSTEKETSMTAAQAAALVKYTAVKQTKDGKEVVEEKPVREKDVLSFRDYGDHVVVVTRDGRKLRGDKK